jgi:hypothetical protein
VLKAKSLSGAGTQQTTSNGSASTQTTVQSKLSERLKAQGLK